MKDKPDLILMRHQKCQGMSDEVIAKTTKLVNVLKDAPRITDMQDLDMEPSPLGEKSYADFKRYLKQQRSGHRRARR